jgi:PiT family inorganic phosphate transporter
LEAVNTGELTADPSIPLWLLVLGGGGFVVGIAFLGSRTIDTIGEKIITKLTPTKSFATQQGAAMAVLTSSVLGKGMSHCGLLIDLYFDNSC